MGTWFAEIYLGVVPLFALITTSVASVFLCLAYVYRIEKIPALLPRSIRHFAAEEPVFLRWLGRCCFGLAALGLPPLILQLAFPMWSALGVVVYKLIVMIFLVTIVLQSRRTFLP
ncbi:MAG: hypothetical protein RhofKO_38300 [Rhodothermales bacterium]